MEKQFKHLSQDEYDKFISYLKEERSKEYEMLLSNEEWEDRFREIGRASCRERV